MKPPATLKILEIGQFCLFKRVLPENTTLIFTGEDWAEVDGFDHKVFDLTLLAWLRRSLAAGAWDIVFCHAPVRPLWDRKHGLLVALVNLLRRFVHTRTLGTYALGGPQTIPLVLLDFNDEPWIPVHALRLLERSVVCFKRELPTDFAKAFLDQAPDLRTHPAVMASPLIRRNIGKLRPISAPVPDDTARMALELSLEKKTDVFFAGSIHSSIRAVGFPVLRSLQAKGYSVDICEGGLSRGDYLTRCARAWLAWSPEGYGWECMRHYEASLCLSVPVLSPPGIFRHQPLLAGEHAIYYEAEGDGLMKAIPAALADKPRLTAMAAAARAHALRHHTHARVVEYMIDVARREIESRAGMPA
jgi:hypothetical protein